MFSGTLLLLKQMMKMMLMRQLRMRVALSVSQSVPALLFKCLEELENSKSLQRQCHLQLLQLHQQLQPTNSSQMLVMHFNKIKYFICYCRWYPAVLNIFIIPCLIIIDIKMDHSRKTWSILRI